MSDRIADNAISLVRRLTRHLNRKVSDIVLLLLKHKSAGSFGAIAGLAIAVVFTWKFLRSPPDRERRRTPKRNVLPSANGGPSSGVAAEDPTTVANLRDSDGIQENSSPHELSLGQIVRKRLGGCRKVTCQLLGVILEEKNPEELQKHATVRPSVVEVLQEITKCCDFYLMERVLDDESEERVLSAMENAGLFGSVGLTREKDLNFGNLAAMLLNIGYISRCNWPYDDLPKSLTLREDVRWSAWIREKKAAGIFEVADVCVKIGRICTYTTTENGRISFVRQIEADWHIDSNLDIISQLTRFIRCQLYISSADLGQIAANVITSTSLEQYLSQVS